MKTLRTYELAKEFYKDCKRLSLSGAMKDHFDRAILSIPLNIAEGNARITAKDRKRFFNTSLASLREIQCILDLIEEKTLSKQADILAAHLYRLYQNCAGT